MEERLQAAYDYVCKTFFPQWRTQAEWSIRRDGTLPSCGKSDDSAKTVILQFVSEDDDSLHLLLIHEICHAVAEPGHGKKWRERFYKAGEKAKQIGREKLADMIFDEVESYADPCKSQRVDAKVIYTYIADALLDVPSLSFEETIEYIARVWGLYPEEVLKYKQCEKIYKQAVRDSKIIHDRRGRVEHGEKVNPNVGEITRGFTDQGKDTRCQEKE